MSEIIDPVFVYQKKDDGKILAVYIDDARQLESDNNYKHIATLHPAKWIEKILNDDANLINDIIVSEE